MDRNSLTQIPGGEKGLKCYRCKVAEATLGKQMKTPNNSTYWRGWCESCVDGKPYKKLERIAPVPEKQGTAMPFKSGTQVLVALKAVVLSSAVGKKAGTHLHVRVGPEIHVVNKDSVFDRDKYVDRLLVAVESVVSLTSEEAEGMKKALVEAIV